jgi:glycosyltransferase involved in cell wall biosynthesis
MRNKILFILPLPPPIHGASIVGMNIKESLFINKNFNCRYINLNLSKEIDDIGKSSFSKFYRYICILFNLLFNLLLYRPNLVYLTLTSKGIGFYKDAFFALLVKFLGFNIVYHFHNKGIRDCQNNLFDNWLYKMVFQNATIILLSKLLYPDIEKYVPEDKVYYCPNGIPDIFSDLHLLKQSHFTNIINILFLSNLIVSKGVYILLESCAILQQKNITFQITFVGSFGDINRDEFTKKVKSLNLDNKVFYLGKKIGIEKEYVYKNADIFVFPTYYHNETFGLVNLEAMQNCLPVITTNEGAISEVVDNGVTGFIIPKCDPYTLAEKLEILILNKELRLSMGLAGRDKFEKEFTITHFEKKLTSIIKQIINNFHS